MSLIRFAPVALLFAACSSAPSPSNEPAGSTSAAPATPATSTTSTTGAVAGDPVVMGDVLSELPGGILVVSAEGDIEVISPDGTERTTLDSADDALLSQPTWATDAATVSWTSVTTDGPTVEVHDLTTGSTTSFPTPTPAFYHAWSAGRTLATLRSSTGAVQLDVHDAGSGISQEVAIGQPFYLDWTDGTEDLVIAVNGASVARVDVAAGSAQNLELPAPLGVFQSPSVLPDASFLVSFAAPNGFELVRVGTNDTITRIARFDGVISMATSPDGRRVAVLVSPDPSAPRLEQASFQTLPELPSGAVSVIDLDTGTIDSLPHRDLVAINWSPDGSWLSALQLDPSGARWLHTRDATTETGPTHSLTVTMRDRYLPFADQYNQSHSWWSPDSRAFVFAGSIDGVPGVWVDVLDDGALPAKVADGSVAFWSPS